jgi:hypothetical protein
MIDSRPWRHPSGDRCGGGGAKTGCRDGQKSERKLLPCSPTKRY